MILSLEAINLWSVNQSAPYMAFVTHIIPVLLLHDNVVQCLPILRERVHPQCLVVIEQMKYWVGDEAMYSIGFQQEKAIVLQLPIPAVPNTSHDVLSVPTVEFKSSGMMSSSALAIATIDNLQSS